ncbi:MAG: CvpA family protein [Thiobacillus sp.]
MSLLDIIVLLILVLTVVRGLMRGMIDTLFSLVAWILAFLLAKWGALMVAPLLPIGVENPAIRYFAGYAVIFLVVLIGVLLLGHALASLVKAVGLGSADKVLGGVLGLTKGGGDSGRADAGRRIDFATPDRFLEAGSIVWQLANDGSVQLAFDPGQHGEICSL